MIDYNSIQNHSFHPFHRFTSIYLRASISIYNSIYDRSRGLVRISFQGVASAVLWESWKSRQTERERICAPRICVWADFSANLKDLAPSFWQIFRFCGAIIKNDLGRGGEARAAAPGNVIKIFYARKWRIRREGRPPPAEPCPFIYRTSTDPISARTLNFPCINRD